MTSYDTPYNRQLGRAQRLYDYADIDQDREDIDNSQPLNGGLVDGGNAYSGGSLPADIADEIPENKIVGGQRRGAEMSDIIAPSGRKDIMRPAIKGGKKMKGKGEGLVKGGDFFNDLIGTVGNVAQTAGHLLPLFGLGSPSGGAKMKRKLTKGQMEKLLKAIAMRDAKRGRGQGAMSGGDQIMDTDDAQLLQPSFTNMGHSGRHNLNTNAVMGNGMSGGIDFGRLFNQGKALANQGLSYARQGCKVLGNGQPSGGNAQGRPYDFYEGMGEERPVGGMYNKMAYNGSGVISDLGIPGISQIAGLFGLGQPSGGQSPDEDEIMKSFLGGRRPSEVPKEEKNMLMRKALADAQLASEVKMAMERAMTGRGLSGGELPMMERMVGGDFFNDLIGTVGNVAQTAGHLLPLFGLGQPSGGSGLGNLRHRLKGGAIEDGMPFNSPPPSMYYSNTPITGGGMSGGAGYDMEDLQKAVMLNQAMSQAPMMASGQPSGGQMVGGRQMRGGDFFNDLIGTVGNVAQTAGHLLPLFGLGQPSGGMMDMPMSSSELEQNAVSGGRMRRGRHLLLKPQMRGSSLSGMGQPSGGDQADLDYQPMKAEYETQGSYGDPDERGDTKGKGEPSGGKKPRGSSSRNAIVAKVMREKGMKLVEASKYVKAHNLYKK